MPDYKCPKCGKVYKRSGTYYEKHIESCTGKKPTIKAKKAAIKPKKIKESISISKRLEIIEYRLDKLEKDFRENKLMQGGKSGIPNDVQFLGIITQKIQELSQKMLGIQKVLLKDLYEEIIKDYNISLDEFSGYLLKLNHNNKVQLEPGMSTDDFFIKDNYGNVFKLIRILD